MPRFRLIFSCPIYSLKPCGRSVVSSTGSSALAVEEVRVINAYFTPVYPLLTKNKSHANIASSAVFLLVDNIVGVIACIWHCAFPNVGARSASTAQQTRPSVDNWGLLSFVLNLGSFRPDRAGGFRLSRSSTPLLPSGIYFRGFVYRLAGMVMCPFCLLVVVELQEPKK